jgi:hypothetical protein
MQYALLIYESPTEFALRQREEGEVVYVGAWRTYYKAMVAAGIYLDGNPLEAPETGTTLRERSGQRQIQDGPYASTKEQLGGFILLELPSLDAALEWAARCPAAAYGSVEVRPIATELMHRVEDDNYGKPNPSGG